MTNARARHVAETELREEQFRAEIERYKRAIRARQDKPWWHYLCPFVITIKRRD